LISIFSLQIINRKPIVANKSDNKINIREVQCKTENPETLATLGTHDKGQRQKNIKTKQTKNKKTKKIK
jgi:hypothetical protein